jgi:hypothetical protein
MHQKLLSAKTPEVERSERREVVNESLNRAGLRVRICLDI